MWALHVTGGLDEIASQVAREPRGPYVRAWSIQLALDRSANRHVDARAVERSLAGSWHDSDPSPVVRLYLASACTRLPCRAARGTIVEKLIAHSEDADDHNLPLMYWYAAEPLVELDPARAAASWRPAAKVPLVQQFLFRRHRQSGDAEPRAIVLVDHVLQSSDADRQRAVLEGSLDSAGRTAPRRDARRVGRRRPRSWPPAAMPACVRWPAR